MVRLEIVNKQINELEKSEYNLVEVGKLYEKYNSIKEVTREIRNCPQVSSSDENGRVGRMIMFRECLYNDIMPFYIEDRNRDFYIRRIKVYQNNNIKGYLIDTFLNSQDNYEKLVEYFLEEN